MIDSKICISIAGADIAGATMKSQSDDSKSGGEPAVDRTADFLESDFVVIIPFSSRYEIL